MKRVWWLVLLGLHTLSSHAQTAPAPPQLNFHVENNTATRGSELQVQLLALNTGNETLTYTPATELQATLHGAARSWVVSLHPMLLAGQTTMHTIAAGQFVIIPYVLNLPPDAQGRVELELSDVAGLRAVMNIGDSEPTAGQPNPSSTSGSMVDTLKQQEADAPPTASRMERAFANRFGFHEPIYFLYGTEAPAAKFQFSFKYRLIGEDSKFGNMIPPFRGFYFGYTQTSLWDVDAASSPFYDTSYMPELFFEWLAPDNHDVASKFHWLGLQTGARHESNGQASVASRSLNIAYLRTGITLGALNGWHVTVAPRVFSYLSISDQNPDIKQYRGYGDLQVALAKNDALQLSISTRIGSRGNKSSVLVDVTQPIRIPLINLETYLQLQYFDGYGESLRTYNQKSSVWRLGLGFVR